MKNNMKKVLVLLLVGVMAMSAVACSSGDTTETTTAATTTSAPTNGFNPNASINQKAESDYEVDCEKTTLIVQEGATFDEIVAKLPTEVTVTIPGAASGEAESLFTESFDSADSVAANWTLSDKDGVAKVEGGKYATTAESDKVKAHVTDPEWAKLDTEEYANYVITAKLTGTAENPSNNFGIMFRATGITDSGPDSYTGMYVGIGDSVGQLVIGKAQNNWQSISTVDFDYQPNVEYTLTVVVYNDKFAVLLDGTKMYEGDVDPTMPNGTVGLRTYKQLFECSEFSVSTLGAEDFECFEGGFTELKTLPVTWSCSDFEAGKVGGFGFFGTVTEGLPEGTKAQVKVKVTVRAAS